MFRYMEVLSHNVRDNDISGKLVECTSCGRQQTDKACAVCALTENNS